MERPHIYQIFYPDFAHFILRRPPFTVFSLSFFNMIGPGRRPSSFEGKRSRDAGGLTYLYR